jgi:hypothetical protein
VCVGYEDIYQYFIDELMTVNDNHNMHLMTLECKTKCYSLWYGEVIHAWNIQYYQSVIAIDNPINSILNKIQEIFTEGDSIF